MNVRSDNELLRQFVNERSESPFSELVHRHLDLVFSAARRQVHGDIHLAEDVSQQVFAELAHRAKELIAHPAIPGWLYQTSRRMAAATLRSRNRIQNAESTSLEMNASVPNDETLSRLWVSLSGTIDEAMADLSPEDRDAILLRCFREESFREIGERFGVAEDTARMRFERALDKLRGLLSSRGVTVGAGSLGAALSVYGVTPAPVGLAASIASMTLASTTTAAGAVAATLFMKKLPLIGTLLLGGVSAVIISKQRSELSQIRSELAAARESPAMITQAPSPAPVSDLSAEERAAAKKTYMELLRLRGQFIPMRRQVEELRQRLSATANAGPSGTKPSPLDRSAWNNVGIDSPENAVQTFFWADRQGDIRSLLLVGGSDDATLEEFQKLGRAPLDEEFQNWTDLEIVSTEYPDASHGRVTVLYNKDGVRLARIFKLSRDVNGWRVNFNVGRNQIIVPETE